MLAIKLNAPFYRSLNTEGGQLNYWISEDGSGNWELTWCVNSPTQNEIKAFEEGNIEFSLAVVQSIPFLCFRVIIADKVLIPWNECPFNPNLITDGRSHFTFMKATFESHLNLRISLPIIVIDYLDTIVRHLRLSTLSPEFSRKFLSTVIANDICDDNEYSKILQNIYATINAGEIAVKYSIIKCLGGD
jgi:hypothetical protein